jgi:Peptidase propeptide and YPEB domain
LLALVLVAALLVARSCGKTEAKVSQDDAIAIAEEQVDFEPNNVIIRLQKRGLRSDEFWLVGLGIKRPDGSYERATNVLIDADTGDVVGIEDAVGGGGG